MITLRESLLGNTKKKVAGASDMIQIMEIRDKLVNSGWYSFGNKGQDWESFFKIYKKNGKWTVDVGGNMFCYGTPDGGMTDGTFRFGTINGSIFISAPHGVGKNQIKSLMYGPVEVKGAFQIWDNEYLKDLKDCPKYVHDAIIVNETPITTLKYFPIFVGGSVMIYKCKNLKKLTDTKDCEICGLTVEFKENGFVSNELSFRDLNWNIRCGSRGYRFDKSIADMN